MPPPPLGAAVEASDPPPVPAPPDGAPGETRGTRHGYNLIHGTTADMTYWVVSNLNMSELQEFVSLVQQPALPSRAPH